MDKEIIFLATGKDWELCPFDKEVWSMNGGYKLGKVDLLFLTDKLYTEYDFPNFDVEEMNKLGIRILSRNHIEGLNYESYPFKEIVDYFGIDYFANSFCYMFAYALYHGIKNITCYGFQFQTPREVIWQKPCLEYWIGRIQGAGGEVKIIGETTLFKHFTGLPYGFTKEEYKYNVDKYGALEKWREIVDREHWKLFITIEELREENDAI